MVILEIGIGAQGCVARISFCGIGVDQGIRGIRNRLIHRRTADQRLRSIRCQPGNATERVFRPWPVFGAGCSEVCVELDCLLLGYHIWLA